MVNSLSATIEKLSPDGTDSIFASTGFSPAFIAVQRTPTLVNISTRLNVLPGEMCSMAVLLFSGRERKPPHSRSWAVAGRLGCHGALADPILELHDSSHRTHYRSNDNWKNNQRAEIEATGIPPTNDNEAALIATLSTRAPTP